MLGIFSLILIFNFFFFNFYLQITFFVVTISLTNSLTDSRETNHTRLTIESNSIQRLVIDTGRSSSNGGDSRALKRVFLSNRTITCNDGSQAGFYLRKSSPSKKWVVFFEGGWHCYDQKSCRARWLRLRHFMTSAQWPETRNSKFLIFNYTFNIYFKKNFS